MRLEQDKIDVFPEKCEHYAGMGVVFDGPYLRGPFLSLVRRGVFKDAVQELDFTRLVGDDREIFFKSFDIITKLKDIDGFGATVNGGGIRIWGGTKSVQDLAIVMSSPDGGMWAAVIDKKANNIRYYTNRPAGETLPKTIAAWRDSLSEKYDVVFVNK